MAIRRILLIILIFSLSPNFSQSDMSANSEAPRILDSYDAAQIFKKLSERRKASGVATRESLKLGNVAFRKVNSPAGCTGYTYYPHYSRATASASVHGRMVYDKAVQRVETVTVLYRERWYGLQQLQVATAEPGINRNKTKKDASPHYKCAATNKRQYYGHKAYSAHASLENGVIYKAETSNWQIPGISRFKC